MRHVEQGSSHVDQLPTEVFAYDSAAVSYTHLDVYKRQG